jgi:two-component system sensor histidine kinase/response regulator
MTAHAMKGDRERCLAAGMDEYISKPIAADTLFKTIGTLVPSFCKTGKEFTDADEGGDEVHFDRAGLLKAFDDDWDFLVEAVEMFFTDFPPMLEDIRKAIASGDDQTLRRAAHSLKGMLLNFQADTAASAALALEVMGRDRETGNEKAYPLLEKLELETERFRQALERLISQHTL